MLVNKIFNKVVCVITSIAGVLWAVTGVMYGVCRNHFDWFVPNSGMNIFKFMTYVEHYNSVTRGLYGCAAGAMIICLVGFITLLIGWVINTRKVEA